MKAKSRQHRHSPKAPRIYQQGVRAEQTEANTRSVLDAAVALVRRAPSLAGITLDQIASDAGVTVRTILRRFGSRDGIMEAALFELGRQFESRRPETTPGDVEAALQSMLYQYEHEGDINVRALVEEHQIPVLHQLLEHGRATHRQWVTRAFAPQLARLPESVRESRITALYAATEVYLWKLLRRDLQLSAEQTLDIFRQLVLGVLSLPASTSRTVAHPSKKGE